MPHLLQTSTYTSHLSRIVVNLGTLMPHLPQIMINLRFFGDKCDAYELV